MKRKNSIFPLSEKVENQNIWINHNQKKKIKQRKK